VERCSIAIEGIVQGVGSEGACAAYHAYGRHLEASRSARGGVVQLGIKKQPQEELTGSAL